MADQSKTYENATQEQFDAISAALTAAGHPVTGLSGSFDAGHGFAVKYSYDQKGLRLVVSLSGSIWLMPVAWGKIEGYIHPYLS